jgi:hypothetical protein
MQTGINETNKTKIYEKKRVKNRRKKKKKSRNGFLLPATWRASRSGAAARAD